MAIYIIDRNKQFSIQKYELVKTVIQKCMGIFARRPHNLKEAVMPANGIYMKSDNTRGSIRSSRNE